MKVPGRFSNPLLLIVSLSLSILILEIVLRNFFPIGSVIYRLDERYLHQHISGTRKLYGRARKDGGQRILVRINSNGYRGDEIQSPKIGKRIAFYGDSFIAAEFSRHEDTLAEQVEERLRALHSPPPEAINAGVVGYGPDQSLLRLQAELDFLDPDLTVVAVFSGNDYGDLLRNKLYRLDEDERLITNDYSLDDSLRTSFESVSPFVTLRVFRRAVEVAARKLRRRSKPQTQGQTAYEDVLIEHWLDDCNREFQSYVIKGDRRVTNLFEDHWDADIALTPSSPSSRYKIGLMRELLREYQRTFTDRKRRWLLLIIPSPLEACADYPLAPALDRYPEYRRERLTGLLAEMAEESGIPHLDLLKPFQSTGACDFFFSYPNNHWNDRGQELAARLVVDFIQDKGLLGARVGLSGADDRSAQ